MTDPERRAKIDAHIQRDAFARWLGAEVTLVEAGHSRPACVGVTSKGYELTEHGKEELRKREIPMAA